MQPVCLHLAVCNLGSRKIQMYRNVQVSRRIVLKTSKNLVKTVDSEVVNMATRTAFRYTEWLTSHLTGPMVCKGLEITQ